MPQSCVVIYIHLVWATWDRLPLIEPELEPDLYACIAKRSQALKSPCVEIGGTEDHVHALVRLHSTICVAELVKDLKGGSSHFVKHLLVPGQGFQWQGTYGAFSVGPDQVDRVRSYIRNQKAHHAHDGVVPDWERCLEIDLPDR